MEKLRPSDIYFTQDSIGNTFGRATQHNRRTIGDTLDYLVMGRCSIESIPRISVKRENGKWFTADNRRLWIFRHLEKLGKCSVIPVNVVGSIDSRKRTSCNGGVDVRIYKGRDPGGCHWKRVSSIRNLDKPDAKVEKLNNSVNDNVNLKLTPRTSPESETSIKRAYPPFEEVFGTKWKQARSTHTLFSSLSLHKINTPVIRSKNINKTTAIKTQLTSGATFIMDSVKCNGLNSTRSTVSIAAKLFNFCYQSYPLSTFFTKNNKYTCAKFFPPNLESTFFRKTFVSKQTYDRHFPPYTDFKFQNFPSHSESKLNPKNDIFRPKCVRFLPSFPSANSIKNKNTYGRYTEHGIQEDKDAPSDIEDDTIFAINPSEYLDSPESFDHIEKDEWGTSDSSESESENDHSSDSEISETDSDDENMRESNKSDRYDHLTYPSSESEFDTLSNDQDCVFDYYESDSSFENAEEMTFEMFTSLEFKFDSESSDEEEDYRTSALDRIHSEGFHDSDSDNMIFDYID